MQPTTPWSWARCGRGRLVDQRSEIDDLVVFRFQYILPCAVFLYGRALCPCVAVQFPFLGGVGSLQVTDVLAVTTWSCEASSSGRAPLLQVAVRQ